MHITVCLKQQNSVLSDVVRSWLSCHTHVCTAQLRNTQGDPCRLDRRHPTAAKHALIRKCNTKTTNVFLFPTQLRQGRRAHLRDK